MSTIESIRKAYKDFKKGEDEITFTDEETRVLLTSIVNYILKNDDTCQKEFVSHDYIPIKDFTDKYIFIAPKTVIKYCQYRDEFRDQCAIKHLNRWFIHEVKAIEYLKKLPRFKTRIDRGFFSGNLSL